MTTIAFKKGVLAFDSKLSTSGDLSGYGLKGRKTAKFIVAACGTYEDCCAFLDWMSAGGKPDDRKKFGIDRDLNISALAINKKGTVFQYDGRLYPYKIDHKFFAIGSGSSYAIGAMESGSTAVQAVKISAKYDANTGGTIRLLSWD